MQPNPELHTLVTRKLEIKRKQLQAAREYGLAFYKPHPKQLQFHLAQSKFRGVFAGNRFGKSQCGVAEDCSWIIGERPFLPKDHPGRTSGIPQRPVKGLIISTDWDKSEEIFTNQSSDPHLTGKIWKNLPQGFAKRIFRNSSAIDRIEFNNGSILAFDTVRSYMQNKTGSESSDWDFIHVDEPIPIGMWKAVSRGLIDRDGSGWFTLTNLEEPWIFTMFFPSTVQGAKRQSCQSYNSKGRLEKWAIVGSIYDNPYLTVEAIESFEATLTNDEKQCRLYGHGLHLSGLVYKEFDYPRHVLTEVPAGWKDFAWPPKEYTLNYAVDTHPRKPHEVLFCWVSPAGRLYFAQELFVQCFTPDLCQMIVDVKKMYPTVGLELLEKAAWDPSPRDGKCAADDFHDFGLYVEPAPKDLKNGILAARKALKQPDLCYFSPNLPNFFGEIMKYGWDKKNPEKPVDEDDHAMECFYRLILSNPQYIEPSPTDFNITEEIIDHADLSSL